jgi:crossover junction endodeoxyribonuclease RuvC
MRIIGIDPGTLVTGWGIVDKNGSELTFVCGGCIRNKSSAELPARFSRIHRELRKIFQAYQPDQMAVEGLFYCKNVKTAIKLGEARGIAMLVAEESGAKVFEYAPRRIKQAVIGRGAGQKGQVQYMIRTILNMEELPQPHDAADALAIAVCHAFSVGKKV